MAKNFKIVFILLFLFFFVPFSYASTTAVNCWRAFLVDFRQRVDPGSLGYVPVTYFRTSGFIRYADSPLFFRYYSSFEVFPGVIWTDLYGLVVPSYLIGGDDMYGRHYRSIIQIEHFYFAPLRPDFSLFINCLGYYPVADLRFGHILPYPTGEGVEPFYSSLCSPGQANFGSGCEQVYSGSFGRLLVYSNKPGGSIDCPSGQFYSPEHLSCRPCEVPLDACQVFGDECSVVVKPVEYHFSYTPDCSKIDGNRGYVSFTHSYLYNDLPVGVPCGSSPSVLLKYKYYDPNMKEQRWSEGWDVSGWPGAWIDLGFTYKFVYSYTLPGGSIIKNETEPFTFFCCVAALDFSSFEKLLSALKTSFPISLLFWADNFLTFDQSEIEPIVLVDFPHIGSIVLQHPDLFFFRALLLLFLIFSIVRYLFSVVL